MHASLKSAKMAAVLGAVLIVLAGTGAVAVSAAPASSPWNQTDYNAAQSRANLTEKTLTPATVGGLRYLRGVASPLTLPGKQGCIENNIAAPVLTGGNMYAVTNGRLTKYNAATGSVIWRRVPDPTFSRDFRALAVAGGLVVVGELYCDSESDPDGYIQAFNAFTGALVWSTSITPNGNGALTQMVVFGGYVVAAGASDGGGNVVSVRQLATGASVWDRETNQVCGPGAVLVVAQLVMSTNCDLNAAPSLAANNLATGAPVWSLPGAWQLQRGDLGGVAARHLYAINPSGTVVGVDPLTGKTQYSLAGATQVLAVDSGRVYADCGSLGVCAYSTAAGSRQWNAQPGSAPALAAEAGGVLYLDQGNALNTATGQTIISLWNTGKATALVIGDGRIAAVTDPRVLDLYGLKGF